MTKIKGPLCKLKKEEIKELDEEIREQARKAKYICGKCLRVSKDKELLCKPEKLGKG